MDVIEKIMKNRKERSKRIFLWGCKWFSVEALNVLVAAATAQIYGVNNARSYGLSVRCIKDK
jgi:hypothetical protein